MDAVVQAAVAEDPANARSRDGDAHNDGGNDADDGSFCVEQPLRSKALARQKYPGIQGR